MRIRFAGSFSGLDPIVIMFTTPGTYSFDKTLYPGYTIYDVMVVGAGGGNGGGLEGPDPDHVNWNVINFGGAGGGGGSHRLRGLLDILDNLTDVVVGAPGANGTDGAAVPENATDGEDGESSSFGDFVMATGGKGGRHSYTLSYNENQIADGGEGGIGGRNSPAGGGAPGGICGLNNDPENVEPLTHVMGTNGGIGELVVTANSMVGAGGGGGAGGSIRYDTDTQAWQLQPPYPTLGGSGSYDSDQTVFSPGGYPEYYTPEGGPAFKAKPGKAGGARVTPFNKSNATYGDSRRGGVVILRLTVD